MSGLDAYSPLSTDIFLNHWIQVLSQLAHKALIIQDVKDAVAAGKIVTISQSTISYQGWTGAGYSIVDPNTGAGAYLIGGGQDGAWLGIALLVLGQTIIVMALLGDLTGMLTTGGLLLGRLRKRNLKHAAR